ncbi:unnamed protein product [Prorocentrum cordatum]|uniref:Uncharacterized protein n=1 Tax=Prorocentrum cordatum TaxID=2364126 RepID=A0ABN9XVG6_9DINO|nr:unnamed protein product [Polarella glacialis]
MWRSSAAGAAAVAAPPEALLNATRELGPAGPEVVLAVVDRGGDVQATARALLERRHWLQLVDLPRQLPAKDGGAAVTIFHFIGGACGAAGASPRRRCGRAREGRGGDGHRLEDIGFPGGGCGEVPASRERRCAGARSWRAGVALRQPLPQGCSRGAAYAVGLMGRPWLRLPTGAVGAVLVPSWASRRSRNDHSKSP